MVAETIPKIDLPPDRPAKGEAFEAFLRRHYDPHPAQRRFLCDPAQFRAAVAGIGGGKTEIGSFDAVRHSIRYPGAKGLVIAPTYRMLQRSTRLVLLKVIKWWGKKLQVEEVKSENRIVFPGIIGPDGEPSQIFFGHAQDPDSLRAVEVAWFWIDEAPLCKEDAFRIAQGRIRQPGYPKRGWITGTPKGQNWVYRRFVAGRDEWDAKKLARYGFHTWKTRDNPLYDAEPEFIEALTESYGLGTDFYRQELEAEFISFAGLVYKQFSREKHCRPHPPNAIVQVIAGVDWGVTAPGCILVLGLDSQNQVWVLDEVYERGRMIYNGTEGDWVSTARELQGKWGISKFLCDPEDANAIMTFQHQGLPAEAAENKRIPGVRAVQGLIAADRLLVVEDAAPQTIAELGQYHWKEDSDGNPIEDADPAKEFDHAMDALRYGVMEMVAPVERTAEVQIVPRRSLDI